MEVKLFQVLLILFVSNVARLQDVESNPRECLVKVDLMIVLDGSYSVTSQNFDLVKDWVKSLVGEMHLNHGHTQVGVVQYSYFSKNKPLNQQRYIRTEIDLGEYNNTSKFDKAVDRIKYQGYQTYTAHALNKTLNEDFVSARNRYPEARRVLILLTDGKATDSKDLPPVINRAIDKMGVVIYAVGVGNFDENELLLITGNHSDRIFRQKSFDDLETIETDLRIQLKQSCDCNPSGSANEDCDQCTKECVCKPRVVGRRCEACASDSYGFGGDEGCIPCRCNLKGSTNISCEDHTGQCHCKPGYAGQNCGECPNGFYGFPDCQPCDCRGYSEVCDRESGVCIDCSGGRSGDHCEVCPAGQYMNENTDGACEPCPCNNNINANDSTACDPSTGTCLKCLYNTAGDNCETCKKSYYGDALNRACKQCECNLTGTDPGTCSGSQCECSNSGQCFCLPNVEGKSCNKCIKSTWKFESGTGCEECDCDTIGSVDNVTCNESTGQCSCNAEYTGRTCSECATGFRNPIGSDECVDENTLTTTTASTTTTSTTTASTTTSTTTSTSRSTSTRRPQPIRINSGWSPCATCFRKWPSYCRGWTCRRRWPYHQQYPSPRRCYAWQWNCRSSMENQRYTTYRNYLSFNRPVYYRGYYHHRRYNNYQRYRPSPRYNLYKSRK